MKYSKNIIATVLICAVASTVAFAAAKAPTFKLDDKTIKCKIENGEIWVRVPKNFVSGTLVNEDKQGLKLTEENYKKAVKVGNTYKDVCKILGGKGKLERSHKAYFFSDDETDAVADTYVWKKKGKCLATIRIQFINGVIEDIGESDYYDW